MTLNLSGALYLFKHLLFYSAMCIIAPVIQQHLFTPTLEIPMSSTVTTENRTTWNIDPAHSGVHFSVKHLVVATVRGQFDRVSGAVTIDLDHPGRSSVHAVIDASSINTR